MWVTLGYTRSPVLKPEIEVQLAEQMKILWNTGHNARQIVEKLHFGEPMINGEPNPYAKLKKYHVWFYRSKFNKGSFINKSGVLTYPHLKLFKNKFPKHIGSGISPGQSRYKSKHKEIMPFSEFKAKLNEKLPYCSAENTKKIRAFLILQYWTPLRRSEILERLRKDFELSEDGTILTINLQRKKKYYRPNAEPEPFDLTLENKEETMLDEVFQWIKHFRLNDRPFNFSGVTAWRYTNYVFPGYYSHFWRFNYITKAIRNSEHPERMTAELLKDTGLDLTTVNYYIMADPRMKATITKREIKKMKGDTHV